MAEPSPTPGEMAATANLPPAPPPPDLRRVPIDLLGPWAVLWPFAAARMLAFSRSHYEEAPPEAIVRGFFARLAAEDPGVRLVVLLAPTGGLVGHLAGCIQELGPARWLHVLQAEVDPGVDAGEAMRHALEDMEGWAGSLGAKQTTMVTSRETDAWARRYGFRSGRTVYTRDAAGQGGPA